MFRTAFFFLLLVIAMTLPRLSAEEPVHRLRVLSWNLHHGEGEDGKLDLPRIAAVIKAQRPDLVALQEIDNDCARSGKVDQTTELARLTGMHGTFGKAMDYDGGEYGQAILSKQVPAKTKVHRLPGPGEPRIAFEARISVDGVDVHFISVHLSSESRAVRGSQAEALATALAPMEGPAILAGDFNDNPGSEPMKSFAADWKPVPKTGPGLTCPAGKPETEIDHILVRGMAPGDGAVVVPESVASDHRPVFAELPIPK